MIFRFFLTGVCLLSFVGTVSAQDGESGGYVPPPMFGAPRVVADDPAYKNSKTSRDAPAKIKSVQPKVKTPAPSKASKKLYIPPAEKIYDAKPMAKKKAVAVPKAKTKSAPKPKAKAKVKKAVTKPTAPVIPKNVPRVEPLMEVLQQAPVKTLAPVVVVQEVIKPVVQKPFHPKEAFEGAPLEEVLKKEEPKLEKLIPLPLPDVQSKEEPDLEPIDFIQQNKAKPTSQGIVKGPKTMPAYKKQGVESEVLYAPETKKPVTLIDRVQQKFSKKKEKEEPKKDVVLKPSPGFVLPQFNVLADGSRKLNMVFESENKVLNDDHFYTTHEMILPLMRENNEMRLRLESYASVQSGSLSGDRRVALSRVMDLREFLLKNDIAAQRIDVRSLGADTQSPASSTDRIEIYIVQ